ncbi:MAG: ABC transporter ATP-binding protein [Thermoanaerobaculia bacterium]|nr:ABC transporter ATP-binding protein [Thermoanaerobaculia bacterium]
MPTLLRVQDLVITAPGYKTKEARALIDGISFDLEVGESVGLVARSGVGKSILGRALLGLLPSGFGLVRGSIQFDGIELVGRAESEYRLLRGRRIALVPQHPSASLDPLFTIGQQIDEVLRAHRSLPKDSRRQRIRDLLTRVEMPEPDLRSRQFPHQLSGGQQQRAVLALALAGEPSLLIADEPTTALDVTVQAKIITLLGRLRREANLTLLLMTHDLSVVANLCDRVLVLHDGKLVEQGPVQDVFQHPRNPMTRALLEAARSLQPTSHRIARDDESVPGAERSAP